MNSFPVFTQPKWDSEKPLNLYTSKAHSWALISLFACKRDKAVLLQHIPECIKTLFYPRDSYLEVGTMSQSLVLYSEWQVSGVVDWDCTSLAKLGLHVPEFHSLHSSRLAWTPWETFCMRFVRCTGTNGHILFMSEGWQGHEALWSFTEVVTDLLSPVIGTGREITPQFL